MREWKGQLEGVMILEEGFAWNGQTFSSLSQIAKAMTGCRLALNCENAGILIGLGA